MTKLNQNNHTPALRLSTVPSSTRQTPKVKFGSVMQRSLVQVGQVASDGLRVAAPYVPGGAIISAALAGTQRSSGGLTASAEPAGAVGISGLLSGQGQGSLSAGNAFEQVQRASQELAEFNASFNIQYLRLQQKMNESERVFTATSNVLKKRDDTAKAMINNIS
ncbi:MAG: hypothetical protein KTR25_10540 [Myxococcales bacterium]|nr:hypothetical protein [Myxococcales bacterium]